MTQCSKESSIGDCSDCNVEMCKATCYQRIVKLFDDKYRDQDNESETRKSNNKA